MKNYYKASILLFLFSSLVIQGIAQTYTISTIAGNGGFGNTGDSGLAINCEFEIPVFVTTNRRGDIYISDGNANVIRKIDKTTAKIYTIAGTGVVGYNGDGISAITAMINSPAGINFGVSGEDTAALFFCDQTNNRIRKINSTTGIINTIAGDTLQGYSGDGGPAVFAKLNNPQNICADKNKNLYFTDAGNHVIRKIDGVSGYISTIAGTGMLGYSGDGGLATAAELSVPEGLALDTAGNIYFCDFANNVIRRIDNITGVITTIAGTGASGYSGDSILATAAKLNHPSDIQLDKLGNIYFADALNRRVRKIDAAGIITTIAGKGTLGFSGDGGPAINAEFRSPAGLRLADSGIIYIADENNSRIRKLTPVPGTGITTITNLKPLIYPNPSKGIFTIEIKTSIATVDVYNIVGARIYSSHILNSKTQINISDQPNGIYFLHIISGENTVVEKIVKE